MLEKRPLERDIERNVCDYAKARGWLTYKFTSPGRAAVPDRLFISPMGKCVFIEFKREGQKPTPAQTREHQRLREQKVPVFVVDNVKDGETVVDVMGWEQ
jgi:hypothetical protein